MFILQNHSLITWKLIVQARRGHAPSTYTPRDAELPMGGTKANPFFNLHAVGPTSLCLPIKFIKKQMLIYCLPI